MPRGKYSKHGQRPMKLKPVVGEKGRENLENIDENSPTMLAFKQFAVELDSKHDRYERIVKLSRDITIESKRIIFLLHNIDRESKRETILQEAEQRLAALINFNFKSVAYELENQDPYQFTRAYSAGLQEYIEALMFFHYLKNNSVQNWPDVEKQLTYTVTQSDKQKNPPSEEIETESQRIIKTLLPPSEFILGIADLTGELMRKCINNLGSGNVEGCFQTCEFVKQIYTGFLGIGHAYGQREISRKCYVLKQSLSKMELVCYNIVVRGSEVPKHTLASVFTNNDDVENTEDEGYF